MAYHPAGTGCGTPFQVLREPGHLHLGFFHDIVDCVPVPDEHGWLPVPDGPRLSADLTGSFLERPDLIGKRTSNPVGENEYRSDPWRTMKF